MATLAAKVFPLLGVTSYEERSGSHYVEERYFIGGTDQIEVKVMVSDDRDHSDRPFWIRITGRRNCVDLSDALIEKWVREKLLPAGLSLARIDKFGQVGEERVDYWGGRGRRADYTAAKHAERYLRIGRPNSCKGRVSAW
ncbi:hypothetical protein KPL74_09210 [Bacillus sp. NP157]|nr:hypothetical protein KPL74_09210 [Bacillus sp. NP157]